MVLPVFHGALKRFLERIPPAFYGMLENRAGNVAVAFGMSILPMMLAMGAAIDLGNQSRTEQKLAGMVDAMALASAKAYRDRQNRESVAQTFLDANLTEGYGPGLEVTELDVSFDDDAKTVSVTATAEVDTIVMGMAGIDQLTTTVRSVVSYLANASEPVSLALALDVSGSMSWYNKIGTLRTAATALLDRLHAADPDDLYVRTGLVTYSTGLRDTVTMNWGISHTRPVIQQLSAYGGTASTPAISATGGWLRGNNERAHHRQQDLHDDDFVLNRFLIFMTDGDNNRRSDDRVTASHCENIKNAGIEIYSVAFEAPRRGRDLLRGCASSEAHYFDARDSAEFLAAFELIGERIQQSLIRIVE